MKLKGAAKMVGKVVYFYVLWVLVMALASAIYASRSSSALGFWGAHPEGRYWLYPCMWAGHFAQKYPVNEQVMGFAAVFVLMGIVAIIAKWIDRKKWRMLVEGNNRRLWSKSANLPA